MGIWKEAETVINMLTYEVECGQLRVRTLEDRVGRDREVMAVNLQEFEQHVNDIINGSQAKFVEAV